DFGGAIERVERLRKARGETPAQFGHALCDRGLGDRRRGRCKPRCLQELTAFHCLPPRMAFNGLIRAQLNANCGSEIRVSESAGRGAGLSPGGHRDGDRLCRLREVFMICRFRNRLDVDAYVTVNRRMLLRGLGASALVTTSAIPFAGDVWGA